MSARKAKDMDFSKRASKYDDGFEGRASRKFYNLLLREIEPQAGAVVLDVGCGTGTILKGLADKAEIVGYGIDIAENMLAEAKKKCPQMTFELSRCDNMPFEDNTFDILISCMSYHHFDNRESFQKEAARVLKPGGVLYIADPRLPWLIRKTVNGVLRLFRINGKIFSAKEIVSHFAAHGFVNAGKSVDFYAQAIKLQKGIVCSEK